MPVKQFRLACFTSYLETPPTWNPQFMRYMIYQKEECPETKKLHWQGYIQLKKQCSIKQIQEVGGLLNQHIEEQKGSNNEAKAYCMKEETRVSPPVEFGKFCPGKGARTDLEIACEQAIEDKSLINIEATMIVKYHKGLEKLIDINIKARNEPVEIILITGPSGSGKSRLARELAPEHGFKSGMDKWWPGYNYEKTVIWDEFKEPEQGDLTWDTILCILDRYACFVETKGGHKKMIATKFILTTTRSPETLYRYRKDLERRVSRVIKVGGNTGPQP